MRCGCIILVVNTIVAGQRAASLTGFAVIDPEPEVVLITIRAQAVE